MNALTSKRLLSIEPKHTTRADKAHNQQTQNNKKTSKPEQQEEYSSLNKEQSAFS